jgi:hypothetical protein
VPPHGAPFALWVCSRTLSSSECHDRIIVRVVPKM